MKARASPEQGGAGPRDMLFAFVRTLKRSAFVRRQTRYTLMDLPASQRGLPAHLCVSGAALCLLLTVRQRCILEPVTVNHNYREEIKRTLEMLPYSKWDITGQHPCVFLAV